MKSKLLITLVISLLLVILPVSLALAATSADVTVTATPSYIAITNAPATWTINGLGGGTESGVIEPNTTYYANPVTDADDTTAPSETVVDGECNFTITNTSSVPIDITVTWGDFTGGGADMTNSDAGTNGTTTYGAFSWFSGDTYASKVVIQSTGSAVGKSALGANTNIKWGCEILTRTDVWTSGTSSTTGAGEYLTVTATAS